MTFFICEAFTCVFLRNINSKQILFNTSQQLDTYITASRDRTFPEKSFTFDLQQNLEFFENSWAKNLLCQVTGCCDNRVYKGDEFGLTFTDWGNYSKRSIRYHKNIEISKDKLSNFWDIVIQKGSLELPKIHSFSCTDKT